MDAVTYSLSVVTYAHVCARAYVNTRAHVIRTRDASRARTRARVAPKGGVLRHLAADVVVGAVKAFGKAA